MAKKHRVVGKVRFDRELLNAHRVLNHEERNALTQEEKDEIKNEREKLRQTEEDYNKGSKIITQRNARRLIKPMVERAMGLNKG